MTNDQQPEDSAAPTPGAAEAPTSITPAAAPQPPAPAAPAVPPVQPYQGQEGWQQPPVGPPGVPAAAPAYQAAPQTNNNAIVALVLALVSYVVCPVVSAIVALIFAHKASKEIKASNGWQTGSGMVLAARILAWVNIALSIIGVLIFIAMITIFAANGGFDPNNWPTDWATPTYYDSFNFGT
ncbi:MAG: DUF4190 domain-containing protein [Actinobacteria bacterium]|nr:MAG: DUF4190 domain-containing protein [Actinomycetota bacterium]